MTSEKTLLEEFEEHCKKYKDDVPITFKIGEIKELIEKAKQEGTMEERERIDEEFLNTVPNLRRIDEEYCWIIEKDKWTKVVRWRELQKYKKQKQESENDK